MAPTEKSDTSTVIIVTPPPSVSQVIGDSDPAVSTVTNRPSYIPPVILPIEITSKKEVQTKDSLKVPPPATDSSSSGFSEDSDFSDNESDSEDDSDSVNSQASIVEEGGVVTSKNGQRSSSDVSSTASPTPPKKLAWFRKYRGMLLAILSSFIFSVSALLVKKLESYDPFNSALYKFQGALLPAIPLLLQKYYCSRKGPKVVQAVWPLTEPSKAKTFGLVLLRSFLTCNALILHFFSLKYLPLSDALTISAASPLFVSILAKLFLGEKCGYSTVIASVCSLLGVVAIAKPPILNGTESFNSQTLIGTGLAFGCTLVTATSFITLRYIRKVHYSVTTLMYGAWGTIENLFICLVFTHLIIPSTGAQWALVAGLAALTLFGQFAIILAMKAEQAGPVALVRTFDVLFAFLFDITVMHKTVDLWSLLGAAVIVLAVVFVGLRKWVRSFPRGHPLRRKMKYIVW